MEFKLPVILTYFCVYFEEKVKIRVTNSYNLYLYGD